MRKAAPLAILLLSFTLVALAGCFGERAPSPAEEPAQVLEVYQVPAALKPELHDQLRSVLAGQENAPLGRVSEGPGDTLIVVAPAAVQRGLRRMLDEIADLPAPAASPSSLRLSYWILVGRPLTGSAAGQRPFLVSGAAKLAEIEPVLAGIVEAQGPTEFRLLERIDVSAVGSDWARAGGKSVRMRQRATMSQGKVVAEVDLGLSSGPNELATRVTLEPGQYVVLGQAGYGGPPQDAFGRFDGERDVTLYYVMSSEF